MNPNGDPKGEISVDTLLERLVNEGLVKRINEIKPARITWKKKTVHEIVVELEKTNKTKILRNNS